MDDYTEKERLEAKITELESALAHQTELLERQEEREKKRRIWFFIKCAIVVVALLVFVPRCVAFMNQTESQIAAIQEETSAFLEDADEKLETVSDVMESLQTIITPLEEFAAKWQTLWH